MAAFVLKINYFEFNGEIKHQISGTAIGTKFSPTYFSIFCRRKETNFLDDVFFTWTHGKEKLEEFLKDFSNHCPNIKFTYEFNKENIPFLDLNVSFSGVQLTTDLHIKSTGKHQHLPYTSARSDHAKRSVILVKLLGSAGHALIKKILR